jgi:hypothetical protein
LANIFPPWTNHLGKALALGVPAGAVVVVLAANYWLSPEFTDVGYAPTQPVPFSHALHAGDMGMDCRYCHNTVEVGARAAIPPAETCMNCHTFVRNTVDDGSGNQVPNPRLAPIIDSYNTGKPVEWVRVHMLPDYAFFDHSVHVSAGVGCSTCHGAIDQMEVVTQQEPLSMYWCLDCHKDPEANLRPRSEVTNMSWDGPAAGYDPHQDPTRTRMPSPPQHCSGCHR